MTLRTRFSLGTAVLVMVLVCFAVSATSAFAATGDSMGSAADLSHWYGRSVVASSFPAFASGEYFFKAPLSSGDTLVANFASTTQLGPNNVTANVVNPEKTSKRIDNNHCKLIFTAPLSETFHVWVSTSLVGTFTAAPTVMSSVSAPSSTKSTSHFTTSILVRSAYPGSSAPIWYVFDKKVSGKWRLYSSHHASFSTKTSKSTKFTYLTKLPRGTFRVCAKFTDATHPGNAYTGHKTITVK